jgi:hypothetical protein
MRYLILSDIHSNPEAFEACVQRAKRAGYDPYSCGNIVDMVESDQTIVVFGHSCH